MYSHFFGYLKRATMSFQSIGTGNTPLKPSLQASQGFSENQQQSFNSSSSHKDQKQLLELQIWIGASKNMPKMGLISTKQCTICGVNLCDYYFGGII
jgi:hypothetical protein